ncbi:MAG: TraU family protein [Candidatus Anstonellales archaeon]
MGKLLASSFLILFLFSHAFAVVEKVSCKIEGGFFKSATQVWLRSLLTLYNIFPVRIGGVTIFNFAGLEDFDRVSAPVCVCLTPFPRVGIVIEFHEPTAVVDVIKVPYCSPTLGTPLPPVLPFTRFSVGEEGESSQMSSIQNKRRGYQLHYFKYYPWSVLELLTDFICLDVTGAVDFLDLAYPTELDPLYQWDVLADILAPESLLFANPIVNMACAVDSVAATIGYPLSPLYWCVGTWGNLFPLSKAALTKDAPETQALDVSRLLFKMHREFILWCSAGKAALCNRFPCPIWIKGEYSIYPIYPVLFPKRQPLGRSSIVAWGFGQEVPILNRHMTVWMVYRKRSCCAF